jgi:hypothetical protein
MNKQLILGEYLVATIGSTPCKGEGLFRIILDYNYDYESIAMDLDIETLKNLADFIYETIGEKK